MALLYGRAGRLTAKKRRVPARAVGKVAALFLGNVDLPAMMAYTVQIVCLGLGRIVALY
jgi:hypothetical protein